MFPACFSYRKTISHIRYFFTNECVAKIALTSCNKFIFPCNCFILTFKIISYIIIIIIIIIITIIIIIPT